MKTKKLYKFLRKGLKSDNGESRQWKIGEWRHEDTINICNSGFHASQTPLQALGYVPGEILAEVEVKGESIIEDDKECWSDMRIVKAYHWKKADSVALSIFAAELVIKNYEKEYPNDTRPRDALEAVKKVLADDTEENRSAARSAESAASAAARSARSAAWSAESAARSAAWLAESAAESAARSAARSAESAAWLAESAAASAASAAESAARSAASAAASAAESAAWLAASAAWSAASAAESAAKKKLIISLDKWFLERIKTLEPYE